MAWTGIICLDIKIRECCCENGNEHSDFKNGGNFCTSWGAVNFPSKTALRGDNELNIFFYVT